MAVTTTNLIAGPGTLYTAAFGAAEPDSVDVGTAPATPTWTDVGATQGGVKLTIDQSYFDLEVDQLVDVPERRITKRDTMLETSLAEPTLDNLSMALNGGTVTSSATYDEYDPDDGNSATQPDYVAVIFDGYAPRTAAGVTNVRRVLVRKVLSTAGVGAEYKKDGQTLFPVKLSAHYVSASVKPFRIVDQTS